MIKERQESKYLLWGAIVLLIFLSYLIIKPYIVALISAFILAYLVRPMYVKIEKKTGKKTAAILSLVTVCLLVIIPLLIVTAGITEQAYNALQENKIKPFLDKASSSPWVSKFNLDLENLRAKGINFLISLITSAIKQIPLFFLSVVITLWGMYHILLKWDFLARKLKYYLPFENKEETIKEIDMATRSIVHGTLLIAVIDLIIAALGFYILGIPSYLLLAALIALLAFIPGLGSPIVWLPVSIFYLLIGDIGKGIGVLILGIIISVVIETFLATKIIEKRSGINPLIAFIGVLGGVVIFGVFGFIIGPLILVYTLKILENLKNG
ncbi:MAG: AI-2E family transporter [Nanoarchaeota archaeon]|nr:AI-2E family transporter [Nanoarchaeota archaeon]